jgi:hypothetical protein
MKDYLQLQYYIFKQKHAKSRNRKNKFAMKAIRIYQKIGKKVPDIY